MDQGDIKRRAQLKCKKMPGAMTVQARYDSIGEVASAMPKLVPLLEGRMPDEPSLEDLKELPAMKRFASSWEDSSSFMVFVRSEGDANVEKAVILLDDRECVCAVASWHIEIGLSFDIVQ